MATVMTSRQYPSGQPPLPARNHPGQSNVTHVKMGRAPAQTNHSSHNPSHEPAPPPLPSRGEITRKKSFETASFVKRNTAMAFSDPDRARTVPTPDSQAHVAGNPQSQGHGAKAHQSKTVPRKRSDDAPPPPPTSNPPKKPPPNYEKLPSPSSASNPPTQRKQSLPNQSSTVSPAVHTPAAHSPRRQEQSQGTAPNLPARPQKTSTSSFTPIGSTVSPPVHTPAAHSPRRQEQSQGTVPNLPARPQKTSTSSITSIGSGHAESPGRPPKSHVQATHTNDEFESRFRFHEPSDFPEPEVSDVSKDKSYPSRSSVKRKTRNIKDENLGSL